MDAVLSLSLLSPTLPTVLFILETNIDFQFFMSLTSIVHLGFIHGSITTANFQQIKGTDTWPTYLDPLFYKFTVVVLIVNLIILLFNSSKDGTKNLGGHVIFW